MQAASPEKQPINILHPAEEPRIVISFVFENVEGEWRCMSIDISPYELGSCDSVESADLVGLNLRKLERQARAGIYNVRMADRLLTIGMRLDAGEDVEISKGTFPRLRSDGHEQAPRPGRPRLHGVDYFREIGEIYNEARLAGRPPLKEIAERKTISASTAAKHARRARDLGFAGPAQSDGGVLNRKAGASTVAASSPPAPRRSRRGGREQ